MALCGNKEVHTVDRGDHLLVVYRALDVVHSVEKPDRDYLAGHHGKATTQRTAPDRLGNARRSLPEERVRKRTGCGLFLSPAPAIYNSNSQNHKPHPTNIHPSSL